MRCVALFVLCFWPWALFAQSEDSDRGYIQGLLEDALSGEGRSVRLEGFAGALSSRATIDRIVVTDPDGVWLTLEDVALVWTRSAILRGEIEIDEISVARVDFARTPVSPDLPAPEARGAFSLPELPVSVAIGALDIAEVDIGAAVFGEAARLAVSGAAQLSGGAGVASLNVTRLDASGEVTLEGAYDNASRQLRLDLRVQEPEGGIAAELLSLRDRPSIDLSVSGDAPLDDFAADIRLATGGQERLSGAVTLKTETENTGVARRFSADLRGDLAPIAAPRFAEFLGDEVGLVAAGSQLPNGGLILSDLSLRTQAMEITGMAEITADGWPSVFDVSAMVTPPDGGSVTLPLSGEPTRINGARLSAQFDSKNGDRWAVRGTLDGLQRADIAIDDVALQASGSIKQNAGSVDGEIDLSATGLLFQDAAVGAALGDRLNGALEFDWQKGAPLRLSGIDIAGVDYGLRGAVELSGIDGAFDLEIKPDLDVTATDLSRFAALVPVDLSGEARLAVAGRVSPISGSLDLRFDGTTRDLGTGIARLDPVLRGEGRLSLGVMRDEQGLRVEPLRIETVAARIDGNARLVTDASAVRLSARLDDAALVLPGLRGATMLDLVADQSGDRWDIVADGGLPGDAALRFQGNVQTKDQLVADGQLTGRINDIGAYSALAGRRLGGALDIDTMLKADLDALSGEISASGATRNLRTGVASLDPLLAGKTGFVLRANRDDLGLLTISELSVSGPGISADMSGRLGQNDGSFRYALNVPQVGRIVSDLQGPASVSGTAERVGNRWRIDADGQGPGGITVDLRGTVSQDGRDLALSASGGLPLTLLAARLPKQAVSGQVRYDLSVAGPPALSSVTGRVAMSGLRAFSPALELGIEAGTGTIDLSGGQAQVSIAAGLTTGGEVILSGPVSLNAPFNADLELRLDDAILRRDALFETDADGRIYVRGPLREGARISGDITLDEVQLQIPNVGPSYAVLEGLEHRDLPPDVRQSLEFAGLLGQKEAAPLPDFPIDLIIRAPNRIFVRGRGVDAELGGQVRLTGSTTNVVPVGQFDLIRGRIDLLGRRVTLTEGSVSLRGSFDPILNFAATSQVDDVEVMIRLRGPASSPEPQITSSPELPEDEVLSLFLFGRSIEQISPLQAVRLAAAIQTLSGRGIGLGEQIRQGLGVDNLDVGTDAEGNTTATVGGYITENIYTDVTVDSTGDSQIELNFDLTDTVTVRGRVTSDGETGLGLFYERDY